MAFAGNAVFDVDLPESAEFGAFPEKILFAEEVGWLLNRVPPTRRKFRRSSIMLGIPCYLIGHSFKQLDVSGSCVMKNVFAPFVRVNGQLVYGNEHRGIASLRAKTVCGCVVAVIREEGSNGDREMAAALHMVGFDVWDVNVQDLLENKVDLQAFCGLVFVGGFSYADVFGSAKVAISTVKIPKSKAMMLRGMKAHSWASGPLTGKVRFEFRDGRLACVRRLCGAGIHRQPGRRDGSLSTDTRTAVRKG
ncbi:putative Phosphoribosylformylglycinamidine synthase [Hypsibius exemplaris]|uniref:Phosphoribosylformylglycinamidine synthase n=1 Tax=Hypsibius exemplaris TaxID=2072580 RepID=A0A1W0WAK8_HYPEX|nr:putative Phosphoribosylformylglycinamidine synthase [Hypsibius exemplaris]